MRFWRMFTRFIPIWTSRNWTRSSVQGRCAALGEGIPCVYKIPWTGRNVRRLHFKAPTMCLRSKTSGSRFCRTQAKMTCTKCSVEQYDATLKILDWFSFWTEQQSSWRKSKWSFIHRTNEKISNFMYNGFMCMSYMQYKLDVIHIYMFVTTKTPFQYHM